MSGKSTAGLLTASVMHTTDVAVRLSRRRPRRARPRPASIGVGRAARAQPGRDGAPLDAAEKISSVTIASSATRIAAPTTRSRSRDEDALDDEVRRGSRRRRSRRAWRSPRSGPPRSGCRPGSPAARPAPRPGGRAADSRMPIPRPASTRSASTSRMPAYVFVTIGGMPSAVRAMTAGTKPIPPRPSRTRAIGKTIPSHPTDGTARPTLATPMTAPAPRPVCPIHEPDRQAR